MAKPDSIVRALARAGVLPFEQARRYVFSGRITVAGQLVRDPAARLQPGDRVTVDGAEVSLAFRTRALAFHKPAGIVTAPSDDRGGGTVFEALAKVLPKELQSYGWHAVGRLDRATTGLLLFTNDERLVEHVTSPATHLPKRYVAQVEGPLGDERIAPLRQGVVIEDGPVEPAEARVRGPGVLEVVVSEGRHHQVRRMINAVGLAVTSLQREAIGGVGLDVAEGQIRELSDEELREGLRFEPRRG